jgi:hypothetical protein
MSVQYLKIFPCKVVQEPMAEGTEKLEGMLDGAGDI